MDTTHAPSPTAPPSDPSRAGAVWVAGTGAFLLLVAAAVFVASNWDHIPPPAKLAAIGFLTGAFLLAGRALRPALPATAGALTHLGAFLVPIDIVAIGVHLRTEPDVLALAGGLVTGATLWALDRADGSALLRWGAAASVVVAAAGLAGVTGAPAPLVLAVTSVIGLVLGARWAAIGWAVVAGFAPLAAVAGALLPRVPWVLETFALAGDQARWSAVITGVVAAGVLLTEAQRRREPLLAALGLAVAVIGAGTTWWTAEPTTDANLVAFAGVLLAVEIGAALLRRDDFWGPLTSGLAIGAEIAAGFLTLVGAGALIEAIDTAGNTAGSSTVGSTAGGISVASTAAGGLGAALGLTAFTWLVADLRRREHDGASLPLALLLGAGFAPATVGASVCAAAAAITLAGPMPAALAMAAIAGLLVCSGRPFAHATAAVLATLAPLAAEPEPGVAAALGIAGATLLAWAAALRLETPAMERGTSGQGATEPLEAGAWLLAWATALPVLAAGAALSGHVDPLTTLLGAVATLWVAAAILDSGTPVDREGPIGGIGLVPRFLALATLVPAVATDQGWLVAAALLALALFEAARRDDPLILATIAVSVPALVGLVGLELDTAGHDLGLVLTTIASASVAAAFVVPTRWRLVPIGLAATCGGLGTLLVGGDPSALASFLIMVGILGAGVGVLEEQPGLAWSGGLALVLGLEAHLTQAAVSAAEPFLAPVCALLLVAGYVARRNPRGGPVSSWVAYGPALAVFGIAALLERVDGGSPTHALVAGAVGVVAVGIGGWRRLAAPLFIGTALLVAVAGYESLAVTAALPTWIWLAAGGALLLGAGIALERTDTSPVEGGRRLVDTVSHRFD